MDLKGGTGKYTIIINILLIIVLFGCAPGVLEEGVGDACRTDDDCRKNQRCFDNPNPDSFDQCVPAQWAKAYQNFLKEETPQDDPSLGLKCPGGFGCGQPGSGAVLVG